MTDPTPTRLGRYEIVRSLGKGAMGFVFLARDPLIGRLVALKTFRVEPGADEAEVDYFRSRFIREAQSAGILSQHPGIVIIHDVVRGEGGPTFIAMEYVEGTDLKAMLRAGRPLGFPFIVDLVRQIADALDYAHAHGVVHRDVKPANVIVTPEGRAKITDFGIARVEASNLTQEGQLLGTPNYMAPEQIQGAEVDHRADIFSLGVIVYELLTRQKPFQGENMTVVSHRIVYDDFTPPERYVEGLPPAVAVVLRRALAKDPAQRFNRASDLAADFAAALSGGGDPALEQTQVVPAPPASESTADRSGQTSAAATEPSTPGPSSPPDTEAPPPEPPSATPAPGEGAPRWSPPDADATADSLATPPSPAAVGPVIATPPGPTPVPAAGAPASAARRFRPTPLRLAAVAAVTAVVGLAAGGLLYLVVAGPAAKPAPADPGLQRAAELNRLLGEGLRELQAGDPSAAASRFAAAEGLAPERPRIGELRQLAEHQAEALELAGAAADAATARLAANPPPVAERPARRRPAGSARAAEDHEDHAAKLAAADAAGAAGDPAGGEPAAPSGPASLTIEFVTDQPEGTLLIAANGQRIVNEPFSFFDRVGLFKKKPYRGKITVPSRRVEPGEVDFKIWVAVGGSAAHLTRLAGNFLPGVERRLSIVVAADGAVTAHLE